MAKPQEDELDKLNHIYKKQWAIVSDEEILNSAIALRELIALMYKK